MRPPDRPGISSSTSMASIENAGDGDGLAAEVDGEVSSLEDPTGPILFKKSSTVLVGTA